MSDSVRFGFGIRHIPIDHLTDFQKKSNLEYFFVFVSCFANVVVMCR